jgi:hypothetical protein
VRQRAADAYNKEAIEYGHFGIDWHLRCSRRHQIRKRQRLLKKKDDGKKKRKKNVMVNCVVGDVHKLTDLLSQIAISTFNAHRKCLRLAMSSQVIVWDRCTVDAYAARRAWI